MNNLFWQFNDAYKWIVNPDCYLIYYFYILIMLVIIL